MGSRERVADVGATRAREVLARLTTEARSARLLANVRQEDVASALGLSRGQLSRIERGRSPHLSIDLAVRIFAVLGMDLTLQAYPSGDALRDAAHLALLERMRARCHRSFRWRTEVPFPMPGDLRAWDATIVNTVVRIGVEAETRIRDAQALDRRLGLKERDGGMDRLILVVADTRRNRATLRLYGDTFQGRFPVASKRALELLSAGLDPGGNALVVL